MGIYRIYAYTEVATDASGYMLGVSSDQGDTQRYLTAEEMEANIALKELWAIELALFQSAPRVGQHMVIHCDNQVVVQAWQGGGTRMLQLNESIKKLYIKCIQNNWDMHIQYISTHLNPADMPSRILQESSNLPRFVQ